MTGESRFKLRLPSGAPRMLQGWCPSGDDSLAAAFADAGEFGVLRMPAFPDAEQVKDRLKRFRTRSSGQVGLDLKGVMGNLDAMLGALRERMASFVLHTPKPPEGLVQALKELKLPRFALAHTPEEAAEARAQGADAIIAQPGACFDSLRKVGLPVFATPGQATPSEQFLDEPGVAGVQVHSGGQIARNSGLAHRLRHAMGERAFSLMLDTARCEMPTLKIRNMEVSYPIMQGGMGIGVSWDGLAGAVAGAGCVGLVSAIGTAYRNLEGLPLHQGRPVGSASLNSPERLKGIIQSALSIAGGRGAVGVNVLCAINGYEQVVRASVEAGARIVVSGAGLPLTLPGLVEDPEVALVPIVSSARALGLICKTWERRFGRVPDAVILEGPESGGHQGFSVEQCTDPAYTLESILPSILAERDRWGSFPVIVAGGIWDRSDIQKFLGLGASAVQMGTRFIGTFECDAAPAFKETLLKAGPGDIQLMKSPVGLPGRGVITRLQKSIEAGEAPAPKCISDCLSPCAKGQGAREAGYCIADRLADAMRGERETGLFFSGSNGWRLQEMLSVRELVGELTGDYGLERLALA
nr:nitronate monooxygenase [uncultured Holophaga sp.]